MNPPAPRAVVRKLATLAGIVALTATSVAAQTERCEPVAQRAGRAFGCFITARQELGPLPRDSALYWHIDAFATPAQANAAKAPRSTVVRSLGRIWLFTIGEAGWRPASGERIAMAGPLPLIDADTYAAVYMEGVFRPGMRSPIHRHPGVAYDSDCHRDWGAPFAGAHSPGRHETAVDAGDRLDSQRSVPPPGSVRHES